MLAGHQAQGVELRRTLAWVAGLNLTYFGIEITAATWIRSVALMADSIDFLEDAAVNLLVLLAVGWSADRRRLIGFGLAALILVPGLAALGLVWAKLGAILAGGAVVPSPAVLTATGLGALAVNLTCALMLARVRTLGGALSRAAFLSARNDVAANIAIVAAGVLTAVSQSAWPDIVVGLGIAAMNAGAAFEVYAAAKGEQDAGPGGAAANQHGAATDQPVAAATARVRDTTG